MIIPAIGVVEVGEEKNSADEESDQHKSSIDFMKESVLLLVLSQRNDKERARNRQNKRVKQVEKRY